MFIRNSCCPEFEDACTGTDRRRYAILVLLRSFSSLGSRHLSSGEKNSDSSLLLCFVHENRAIRTLEDRQLTISMPTRKF